MGCRVRQLKGIRTFLCEGVIVSLYASGSGAPSHLSARNPPHCVGCDAQGMVNRRPGEKKKEMTNQATISQELQAVLLTNIGHSIQRTGVDERELAIKRER